MHKSNLTKAQAYKAAQRQKDEVAAQNRFDAAVQAMIRKASGEVPVTA